MVPAVRSRASGAVLVKTGAEVQIPSLKPRVFEHMRPNQALRRAQIYDPPLAGSCCRTRARVVAIAFFLVP